MAAHDCEVLVVGAGPTGLIAANLLARSGVKVRIVEQRTEASRESRAFAIQARTLELMQAIGLAEEFVARGVRADSVNIHVRGRFKGGLDFKRAKADDTPFPFILMLPQSETEAILAADCERLGLTIERGMAVQSVVQDSTGVTVTGNGPAGAFEIRAGYVLGADGSRSVVRGGGDFGWHGDMLPQRFLLADCKVEWPLDHDHFRVFLNHQLIGLFLPLKGSTLSRVMATDLSGSFDDGDASKPAPLDLAEMQAGLEAAIALPVKLSDPVWVTRYRAHHRFVDRYRQGRLFVAGDAAHIHSPAGGQGMNTGLQDAANLAWKLAAVIRHGAPDALLDSYDAERRPVGEQVVRSTGKLFNAAAGQAGFKSAIRDTLVSILLPLISKAPPFQRKAFRNASQRAIAYPPSAFVGGATASAAGPGMRAPDAPLADEGSLFGLIGGFGFTLIGLANRPEASAFDGELIAQDRGTPALFAHYGVKPGAAATLVIRPDGYVAWRGDGLDAAGARQFLAPIMGSA